MSEEQKLGPREWTLHFNSNKQTGVIRHKNKYDADDPFCEFVDVIEYSAYEALERELASARESSDIYRNECASYIKLRSEMNGTIDKLQSQLDEANKERELVVNNFHGQVGLNRKASARIKELEAALKMIAIGTEEKFKEGDYAFQFSILARQALSGKAE